MSEKRGKILVIRGGAIGDFILTIPAITALRSTFPETHLELLGYPVVAELARSVGIVDEFRSIEAGPLARFFARNSELDPAWGSYFESFNIVISYLFDPDDIFKTNVARVSKAQFIQAQHRPIESEDIHATSVFLKPLERLAIFDANPVPQLPPVAPSDDLVAHSIAIHSGSGSERKNWSESNWIELLVGLVKNRSTNVLLVGGEAEGDRLKRIASTLPKDRVQLAQSLPLSSLARLLVQCRAFAGHDSGITHLAAALGIPTLCLWGPSNHAVWRPLGPNVQILRASDGQLESLAVDQVRSVLETLF